LDHHGYKCLDLATGKVYVSCHVVFYENHFPYKSPDHPPSIYPDTPSIIVPFSNVVSSLSLTPAGTCDPSSSPHIDSPLPASSPTPESAPQSPADTTPASPFIPVTHPPKTIPAISNTHPMVTRSKNHISKPKRTPDGHSLYPLPRALQVSASPSCTEPTSFTEASKFCHWQSAMNSEFDALLPNQTWKLVPPSRHLNVIGCRWIFKIKRKADGSIERYKARLVAKGYHQQLGVDFHETYNPVVKPATIRLVLSITVCNNWTVLRLDVQNAFLHGNLTEMVYMDQPSGFKHPQFPNHLCKLKRSLYGLKQVPRQWFSRLIVVLIQFSFVGNKADMSLFVHTNTSSIIYILIYVDDIIITGSNDVVVTDIIQRLHKEFAITDLGPLSFFLGIKATRDATCLYLTQRRYIANVLTKSKMDGAKPCSNPLSTTVALTATDTEAFDDPTLYRSIVGGLHYLSFTRPDIAFVVHRVSKFMHQPKQSHWICVKRILRYLKHSISYYLLLSCSNSFTFQAFSDADWAGDTDDRSFVGAYCVFLGSNLVSWRSKQQATVACSSTEAEYKALADTAAEFQWLQFLAAKIGLHLSQSPTLWCDNIGATYLSFNPVFHARTKHIEIDFHFVRDLVSQKKIDC